MATRILLLAAALALPAAAQTPPNTPAPASSAPQTAQVPPASAFQLNIARNDREVIVTWVLPEVSIQQLEIMRGIRPEAAGRGRVASVRTSPAVYYDTVPEADTKYWYWLKITLVGGRILNIGPVPTPEAKVWTP